MFTDPVKEIQISEYFQTKRKDWRKSKPEKLFK